MELSGLTGSMFSIPGATPQATLSQFKVQAGEQLLSLLPAPAPSSTGLGLNMDMYSIIGMQSQGLLSGGRTAIEIANISLGLDAGTSSQTPPAGTGAPLYYSNPSLFNPGLGGLLDSLG